MIIDPKEQSSKDNYRLFTSVLVPRPIAFTSTVNEDGTYNLAPFSFLGGVSSAPPMLAISVGSRRGQAKDTARNIERTGEFVVNLVTEAIAEKMNLTSGDWSYGESEFEVAGLTPAPSDLVAAPRVAESPVNMECKVVETLHPGHPSNHFIIGEVLRFHIDDTIMVDGRADVRALKPIARLGGAEYAYVREIFEMARPVVSEHAP